MCLFVCVSVLSDVTSVMCSIFLCAVTSAGVHALTVFLSLSLHALAVSIANCVRLSEATFAFKTRCNSGGMRCDATLRPAALTAV